MSKERELLRKISRKTHCINYDEIEQLLTQRKTEKAQILEEFPLLDEEGLDPDLHHCEWVLQQERKRLHALLAAQPESKPIDLDQIDKHLEICDHSEEYKDGYSDGIVFAERHHAIRGQHE